LENVDQDHTKTSPKKLSLSLSSSSSQHSLSSSLPVNGAKVSSRNVTSSSLSKFSNPSDSDQSFPKLSDEIPSLSSSVGSTSSLRLEPGTELNGERSSPRRDSSTTADVSSTSLVDDVSSSQLREQEDPIPADTSLKDINIQIPNDYAFSFIASDCASSVSATAAATEPSPTTPTFDSACISHSGDHDTPPSKREVPADSPFSG
jgi:hypothetical protein